MASTSNTLTKNEAGMERSVKIEQAVSHAIDLVKEFSERDPRDGDDKNPWQDPQSMLDELDRAREGIVAASADTQEVSKSSMADEQDFRAAYMDLITNAFADVLDDMRNNNSEEELNVDILVDCLQSGMDFLSGEEQEFLMMDDDEERLEEGKPTPHEERQIQLGVH